MDDLKQRGGLKVISEEESKHNVIHSRGGSSGKSPINSNGSSKKVEESSLEGQNGFGAKSMMNIPHF
jgi:hypothetical protein